MKPRKIIISLSIIALMILPTAALVSVNAADATVNNDTWFVLTLSGLSGAVKSFTSSGSHVEVNITWNFMRSPQVAGTVQIGTAKGKMVSDFNNVTNTGRATINLSINLTETNSTKNPYGVGTMEAVASVDVTSLGTATLGIPDFPANGTGTLISTSGKGAFATALLWGDLVMNPLFVGPLSTNGYTEAIFFGTHSRVNGSGVLIYYPALSASAFCSVTIMRGQTWYFFTQSTGGVGATAFQWFEGSTLLAGQNSMILAMSKATAGAYTYTCVVTDSYGNTVTTNPVTLTVI